MHCSSEMHNMHSHLYAGFLVTHATCEVFQLLNSLRQTALA